MKNAVFFILLALISCKGVSVEDRLPIPDNFKPQYSQEKEVDLTYISQGTKIGRTCFWITTDLLSADDIKNNCRYIVRKTHKSTGIRNVSIFIYRNSLDIADGRTYTVAKYEFCPFGDWGRTDESISTSNEEYDEDFIMN